MRNRTVDSLVGKDTGLSTAFSCVLAAGAPYILLVAKRGGGCRERKRHPKSFVFFVDKVRRKRYNNRKCHERFGPDQCHFGPIVRFIRHICTGIDDGADGRGW